MPVVDATPAALEGFGRFVDDRAACAIEIVRWPAQGSRPVDLDTGDQAGTTQGTFVSEWQGDILFGRNDAVGGHYILAFGDEPATADAAHRRDPRRILLWHANYHPDGGQLFFPLERKPATTSCPRTSSAPLRRDLRVLHPSEHLARGRVHDAGHATLLRPAGCRACARLG